MNVTTVRAIGAEACSVVFTDDGLFACHVKLQMQWAKSTACSSSLHVEASVAVASFVIWTGLSLPRLRVSGHVKIVGFRSEMSKLTRAVLEFLAVTMLLKEFTHRHPIFNHRVQEITLFITFPAVTLHPKRAHFLFSKIIVGLIINRIQNIYHILGLQVINIKVTACTSTIFILIIIIFLSFA